MTSVHRELPYRHVAIAFALLASALVSGCTKRDADDPERASCRSACKSAWNQCRAKCAGDAPLACDADCDRRNDACKEKCEVAP